MWQEATGMVPFGALTTADCKRRIVFNRERPPLENIRNETTPLAIPERLANMLERCWIRQVEQRPNALELVELFSGLVIKRVGTKATCKVTAWCSGSRK